MKFFMNIFIWVLVGNNKKSENFQKEGALPEILKSSFIILFSKILYEISLYKF